MRVASPSSSLNPTSRTASPAAQPAAKSPDPWDFDLLSTAVPAKPASAAPAASPARAIRASIPSDAADDPFDLGFGSVPAESGLATASTTIARAETDDFDLLDAFAAPAASLPPRSYPSPAPSPARAARPTSASPPASDSPPPHVLGHLVEMGFSPSSASAALSATRGPAGDWDIDAAVDALAEEQKLRDARRKKQRDVDEWGDEDNVRVGRRRSWEFDDDDERGEAEARRRRAQQSEQDDGRWQRAAKPDEARTNGREPGGSSRAQQDPAAAAREQAKVLQGQATEMLAQAQKIGFSMFKSANAYWGEGKKVLQKKLEEQRSAMKAAPGAERADGRPKWWREGMDEEGTEASADGRGARRAADKNATFKDSDDEEERPDPVLAQRPRQAQQQAPPRQPEPAAPATTEYRSPFRRAKPSAAPPPPAEGDLLFGDDARTTAPAVARSTPSPRPRSTPSPAPPRPAVSRPHIAVPPSSLTTASKHKTSGNEHFKLGRFGDAAAAYSLALDSLPEGWLGRVPLLNNRAQARLRSGEEKAAATDCTEAFGILVAVTDGEIDLSSLDSESASLPAEVTQLYAGGTAVDLKDQLGKALGRRAKALEADEKWKKAREDWETILKLGDEAVTRGAGGVKMVSDGVARCRKMIDGPSASTSAPPTARASPSPAASAFRPKPRSPAPPVEGSGEAVKALQAQQAAAAAEDDMRLELKDQVDARIAAWKGGKETNLRALIASLDTVLWPGLEWKTVGMHELISDNQLKVRYVRAISKVHPDKVCPPPRLTRLSAADARLCSSMRATRLSSSA